MRTLANKDAIEIVNDFPEILFFTLVVCATTISDIKIRKNVEFWGVRFLILEILLFIGIVLSAIIYGAIRYATTSNPKFTITSTPFYLIISLIVSLLIASLTTQLFVTYSDRTVIQANEAEGQING